MSDQVMTFNFGNKTTARIVIWLEPWAEEIPVDPGSELVLKIHYVDVDTIETEQTAEFFVIWLWRGCRAQVLVDGEDRTVSSMSRPAPV